MCMPSSHRGQTRELDLLETEFQMVVSHHVGDGNKIHTELLTSEPSFMPTPLHSTLTTTLTGNAWWFCQISPLINILLYLSTLVKDHT